MGNTLVALEHPLLPSGFIGSLRATALGGKTPSVQVAREGEALYHVELLYDLEDAVKQDDCYVELSPAFVPERFWSFHLTPEEGDIAEQHVFRTPALAARNSEKTLLLLPDIETCEQQDVRSYMDLDAPNRRLCYGMSNSEITHHVLFHKKEGASYRPGKVCLNFYLMLFNEELENFFRPVLSFYWERYGSADYKRLLGQKGDLTPYVRHTYHWAFESWKDAVWQEFDMNGKHVGAPVFIVNTTQSPNYPGTPYEREFRSVWNQAWFCSLRSASGLYRYAKRQGDQSLLEKARLTKELALAFPQQNGLFDSVAGAEMEPFSLDGETRYRSKGWQTLYFGNSNRNPFTRDAARSPRHLLDMSFTAYYMLLWYEELEQDERLRGYATAYAQRLLSLQFENGFFPGWVDETGKALGVLDDSPETAMSAAFLVKCYRVTGNGAYLDAAQKAMEAVLREVVPEGRYEDFETYWSCCSFWSDQIGKKIPRNDLYKQCNFSMYYTALALLDLFEATGEAAYLEKGQQVLDELLMTQSSYQPRSIVPPVVGGFGVMNADGELNDSRQSLFAELIYRYGEVLGLQEYRERALAALRIAFSMMYCPENPEIKEQWEIVWPFFGPEDYGFTMENYGHGGKVDAYGDGIGEFTIYDWGNGAAAEGFERMFDHYGDAVTK